MLRPWFFTQIIKRIQMKLPTPKELIRTEIKPENRTGTIKQLTQNVENVENRCGLWV